MTNSPNRFLALVGGAGYILIGLIGFSVSASLLFFSTEGGMLFGLLQVNTFHNVVHIIVGAGLMLAGVSSVDAAKTINAAVGSAFLMLGLAGLFLVGTSFNIFALNSAGNALHFGTAAVLLAAALGADKAAEATAVPARTT